jgi:hypothetical protein
MSLSLRLLAVSTAFAFAGAAFAASPAATPAAKPHTAQQQRMVNCNKQATGKKGAERKIFMSSCLKSTSTAGASGKAIPPGYPDVVGSYGKESPASAAAGRTQQQKMKSCNADAKSKALKGTDRKTFMSSCLKGGAAAAS